MAGTVVLTRGQRWSAASWLFDWLLTTVAKEVTDVELAGELTGLVDENLGWLSLKDLPPTQSDEVIKILRTSILPIAISSLPSQLPNREEVLEHLRILVDSVSEDQSDE
jgi:hypothetical protein